MGFSNLVPLFCYFRQRFFVQNIVFVIPAGRADKGYSIRRGRHEPCLDVDTLAPTIENSICFSVNCLTIAFRTNTVHHNSTLPLLLVLVTFLFSYFANFSYFSNAAAIKQASRKVSVRAAIRLYGYTTIRLYAYTPNPCFSFLSISLI